MRLSKLGPALAGTALIFNLFTSGGAWWAAVLTDLSRDVSPVQQVFITLWFTVNVLLALAILDD